MNLDNPEDKVQEQFTRVNIARREAVAAARSFLGKKDPMVRVELEALLACEEAETKELHILLEEMKDRK